MQAKRFRCVCVLPHEVSLIHLLSFLTALPRPRQCRLGLGFGENSLTHVTGYRYT